MKTIYKAVFLIMVSLAALACTKEKDMGSIPIETNCTTKNVIVVIIDGPRYSETWGDPEHRLIPNLFGKLAPVGVINQKFYNNGDTHTLSGHTSVSRGVYEVIENTGREYPDYPSYLQHWLYQTHSNPNQAWIIGSKTKLEMLGNCTSSGWSNSYLPSIDTKDRPDKATFERVKEVVSSYHPRLMFINLRGPDYGGHKRDWELYKYGIFQTDSLLYALYELINNDSIYAGKTTLLMTNDHGRHLDGIQDGFISHGDQCMGCRHINFFAWGPDFISGKIVNRARHQLDLAPTVGYLMGFKMTQADGDVMTELFKEN